MTRTNTVACGRNFGLLILCSFYVVYKDRAMQQDVMR
jgi:hypothetical protein